MPEYFFPEGMTLPGFAPGTPYAGFWEACQRHELAVQRCSNCGTVRHAPDILCHQCHSQEAEWQRVSGKGVVYSHMNVVYPTNPVLQSRVPYNVIMVELLDAQGIRMLGNLVDCPYEEIFIGMPVEVYFEDHPGENITLPLWRRSSG